MASSHPQRGEEISPQAACFSVSDLLSAPVCVAHACVSQRLDVHGSYGAGLNCVRVSGLATTFCRGRFTDIMRLTKVWCMALSLRHSLSSFHICCFFRLLFSLLQPFASSIGLRLCRVLWRRWGASGRCGWVRRRPCSLLLLALGAECSSAPPACTRTSCGCCMLVRDGAAWQPVWLAV